MSLPPWNALASSAAVVFPQRSTTPKYDAWQGEAWQFYDSVGEFEFGVSWLANVLSRVRLLAAELAPGGDEPTPLDGGPAVDLIARLAGGTGGQSQLVKAAAIHLSVPGEFWLVGETPPTAGTTMFDGAEETWAIRSADELRVARRKGADWEIREGDADKAWRPLAPDSLVVRCWSPHTRWAWRADSPARHALGALFELDIINKRIVATTMSRLASNGILLYDRERLSVPARTNPTEADVDPFAAMLVGIASRGIADPASPEATIPIPIGYSIDDLTGVDPKALMQHIVMANSVDPALLAQRDSALRRLAICMNLPAEIILGMGDVSHWGQWFTEESAIKVNVSPLAELISYCFSVGYLTPALKATGADMIGPNGGRIIVWYDPSDITGRPDRSASATVGYDRFELSGSAWRREVGFDEADAPDPAELAAMALKVAVKVPALSASAIESLGGPKLVADFGGAGGAPAISLPGDPVQPGARTGPPVPASNGTGP